MKKIILLLLLLCSIACKDNKKTYKYIEIIDDESITGEIERIEKDTIVLEAENDSLAYLEAYNKFSISKKVHFDSMKADIKTYSTPIEYKLINEKGHDIIPLENVYNLEKAKAEIDKSLSTIDSGIKKINNSSSYINSDDSANPCIISEDYIKQDLQNPSTADFSMFDCSNEKNSDGTYTVLRKVSAKNSYGVEKEFIYKVKLGFKGGNWVDMSNWDLIKIQSEEYK